MVEEFLEDYSCIRQDISSLREEADSYREFRDELYETFDTCNQGCEDRLRDGRSWIQPTSRHCWNLRDWKMKGWCRRSINPLPSMDTKYGNWMKDAERWLKRRKKSWNG